MTPSAVRFGSGFSNNKTGATISTTPLPKPSSCGGLCQSGHLTFDLDILYGKIQVISRWFPNEKAQNVSTATGFIGLDSDGNEQSITFGFHGDGWDDGSGNNFTHTLQTDLYNDAKPGSNKRDSDTGDVDLAAKLNTFEIVAGRVRQVDAERAHAAHCVGRVGDPQREHEAETALAQLLLQ